MIRGWASAETAVVNQTSARKVTCEARWGARGVESRAFLRSWFVSGLWLERRAGRLGAGLGGLLDTPTRSLIPYPTEAKQAECYRTNPNLRPNVAEVSHRRAVQHSAAHRASSLCNRFTGVANWPADRPSRTPRFETPAPDTTTCRGPTPKPDSDLNHSLAVGPRRISAKSS